uniref:Uncharacterized protein n=1 Tax=Caenorhabditis japonica TaxID=281687 RepID=A0A8R1IIK2_CAEJA
MRSLLLFFSSAFLISAKIDHVKEKNSEAHGDITKLKTKEAPEHVDHKKLFTDNFKNRRIEHQTALGSIKTIEKEKRRQFLEDLLKNVKNLLQESRETLERTGQRSDSPFPHNSDLLKDALSKATNLIIFNWNFEYFSFTKTYNYSIKTGIFDEKTAEKVKLMAQQHELIEKTENYFNAYDKDRARENVEAEETQRKQKKLSKKADSKQPKGEL